MRAWSMQAVAVGMALCLAIATRPCGATPLALGTGLSAAVVQGGETTLTLPVTNLDPGDITAFAAFGLAVQIIPAAGATGSVTISGITQPSTNPLLLGPLEAFRQAGDLAPTVVNGSSLYTSLIMSNDDPDQGDSLAAGATANLVTMTLAASADASGSWTIYAINALNSGGFDVSSWFDTEFDEFTFADLDTPAPGSFASVTLGTVTVMPVPEPAACWLACGGVLALLQRRCGGRPAA